MMNDPANNKHQIVPNTSADPFSIGSEFLGRYRIIKQLGSGGWGNVYLAQHLSLEALVAVKVIHKHLSNDEASLKRMEQEALLLSRLDSPFIVKIIDYAISPLPFMVLEYFDGTPLNNWIKEHGPMKLETAIELFMQLCDGLKAAQKQGLVHRDLKPSNVLLKVEAGNLNAKILDFGIARLVDENTQHDRITATGEILGSPPYMPPEQWTGRSDHRTDIYALACIIYEVLSGKPAFSAQYGLEYLNAHLSGSVAAIKQVNPEAKVPPALETLLRKCLQRSPADRYQDCSQIKSDLEKIKSGKTVTIRLAASREELLRKSLVLAAVFIALAGVVGAVFRVPLLESVCFKLNAAGDAKFAEGKSQEAMNDFRQTIFFSQFLSSKNGTKLHAMRMLAALLKEQKLAAEAAVLEEKIRETIGDVSLYPDLIPVFRQCDFEIFNSRFDKAEPLARKAVAQSLRLAGKDSLSYAIGLDKLALCLAANGNFEDAIRLAEEALQISNTLLEPDDMFLARQMNNLAAILSEAGKPEQSNKLFNSARAIKMKNARGRLPWNIDLAPPRRPGS